jgi:hypothetical protein
MAVLIPDVPAKCTGSERQVFSRLERDLDKDWIALHSLGLANHQEKLWGEADFVVLSTKGIFVLEVKGGDVTCRDGVWHFGRPDSNEYYTKKESPFKQAKDAMFALKKIVEARPEFKDLLIGYGVVMPHAVFTTDGPEIEPEVLLDARDFRRPLGFYIGKLGRFWAEAYRNRHGVERRLPTREELQQIRGLLRPDVGSTLSLGSYLNGLEQDLIQLTNRQIRAVRGMGNNPRTIITGKAGTGKTVLAIDRARQLAGSGRDVLFLCFNRLLAEHVRYGLKDDPDAARIRVSHLHGLMRETIQAAGLGESLAAARGTEAELYGRIYPELFVEAALAIEPSSADVLIVDEAQDLLTAQNLDALDLLLTDGLKRGNWNLFLDPLQNIYGKHSDAAMAVLQEAGFASYELYENCRNTREIAVQTSIISGVDMALDGAVAGLPCECVYYADEDECRAKLESEVLGLLDSGVERRDMILLSTRKRENSVISGLEEIGGLRIRDVTDGPDDTTIHYSTIHAFKGLERKVVLAIDLDGIGEEEKALLHYAGLSRAIGMLRPFVAERHRKSYRAQAERFGRRLAVEH